MNISILALRLDEFAVMEDAALPGPRLLPKMFALPRRGPARSAQRRLTLGTYRIQIRDSGLRPFRVF